MNRILFYLNLSILFLLNFKSFSSELVEGWMRYHVTPFANLKNISMYGLDPEYGADPTKKGMSYLYDINPDKKKRFSDEFKTFSKNCIHVSKTWDTTKEYVIHMMVLWGKTHGLKFKVDQTRRLEDIVDIIPTNLTEDFLNSIPIILMTDINKYELSVDQNDASRSLKTFKNIPAHRIFIYVHKKDIMDLLYQQDEQTYQNACFWLPLCEWNENHYEPAYPEEDNQVIQINSLVVQRMLLDRITYYARQALNKSQAAAALGVCLKTLTNFLDGLASVRESTKQKIIVNFVRQFSYFTQYDYHWVLS